jgi:hypothetical protein
MGIEIAQKHFLDAREKYPKLQHFIQENNTWKINGVIDVIDDEGGYWDSYEISIIMLDDYPDSLPILIETSNKIERHIDWHMMSGGVCCLSTQAKMFYDLGGDITLVKWLNKFAHPFLANHVYRIKKGHYASEEFSHGNKGIIEGWKKIIPLKDNNQILAYLQHMVGVKRLSLNQPCFCGSRKKYKRCYLLNQKDHLMNIPVSQIIKDIKAMSKEI